MDSIERAVAVFGDTDPLGLKDVPPRETGRDSEYKQSRVVSLSEEHLRRNRVLTPDSDQSIVVAYNVLRTRVFQRMMQNNWSTLAVTSPMPDEGKTLTAINLSISLARKLDYTVLLIDLDFRQPSIHKVFGFEPEYGVSDFLAGRAQLEDIFVSPGIERLTILPERQIEGNSSEIISSSKMEQLVRELKDRYPSRIIIFDLPPTLVGDDVMAFAGFADAMLLVAREGKTKSDELKKTMDLLGASNLLGTVLNHSSSDNEFSQYGY